MAHAALGALVFHLHAGRLLEPLARRQRGDGRLGLEELHRLSPPATLFASNTSSLSVAELATGSGRPDRFLGLHFFNPVPTMKLVEVAPHAGTAPEATAAILGFAEKIGKTPLRVQDTPAFVVNALLIPFILDAVRMAEKGIATPVDIDQGITLGLSHPMGPFALLDFVGIDTVVSVADVVHAKTGEARYACPDLLRAMVRDGKLGRKSGAGFYPYKSGAGA